MEMNEYTETRSYYKYMNPNYTFDTFMVDDRNCDAYEVLRISVDKNEKNTHYPVCLYGKNGVGKTHLLQATAHHILKNYPTMKVLYITSEKFTIEFLNSIRNETTEEFRNQYNALDVLIIDDIQFLVGKDATLSEFLNIFDDLCSKNTKVIFSSDTLPQDMKYIDERTRSHLQGAAWFRVDTPNCETRVSILKNWVNREWFDDVSEEVYDYIASSITDDVRKLEGAINKVVAYHRIMDEEITLESAISALEDII